MIFFKVATEINYIFLSSFILWMSNSCFVMAAVGSHCADSNCQGRFEICDTPSNSCVCNNGYTNVANICKAASDLQVQNLTVAEVMETSLFLKWEKPVKYDDVSKYTISWKRFGANDFLGTQDVSKTETSFNLSTSLTAGVAYTVVVTSFESSGINFSTSIHQATKPSKPGRINVNGSNASIFDLTNGGLNITWHYTGIIKGIDLLFTVQLIDSRSSITVNGQSRTNYITLPTAGLRNGYWYNISITAMSEVYNSLSGIRRVNSDVLYDSFKTSVQVPDPPSNLICLNANITTINLKWNVPANYNGEIYYYNITVKETSPDIKIYNMRTPRDDLQYTVMNLTEGSSYTFEVYTVTEGYQSQNYAAVDCWIPRSEDGIAVCMCYVSPAMDRWVIVGLVCGTLLFISLIIAGINVIIKKRRTAHNYKSREYVYGFIH